MNKTISLTMVVQSVQDSDLLLGVLACLANNSGVYPVNLGDTAFLVVAAEE
jgi:hypothetical protein